MPHRLVILNQEQPDHLFSSLAHSILLVLDQQDAGG
jgi:hypothetical protein